MNVSNTDTTQAGREASVSAHDGARDPADRLEQALTRIAFAIECREEGTWPPAGSVPSPTTQPTDPGIDLQALAANIDALIARVRDALSDGGAATVIADIKGK
ncbi:hypothetical protein IFJ82_15095 [Novacetimonas hansenii]|uniref:Uncharacterized protein n=2 Tax=Novacetimonas hansenii TaxID=436 RepID=A0AAW5ESC2_NOVHA|nr:hypothetical protein [Novacetimonas hansenii]EFG85652.1 hypothetical protein GXY_02296 [Novacetimonas hansenii ATCC 23769]MBL7238242.1 hypothetical protein [Novacetimonas hansenii]MCJ8353434.1 hypothetical protein [Novacetimonas hansenii]PYD72297.1 hypothetical protein CFR74_09975 [Novacetimonas hansenii]QOF95096.1 hypothetical protein IFJ82_15095 [Novacetimonas hansenii]